MAEENKNAAPQPQPIEKVDPKGDRGKTAPLRQIGLEVKFPGCDKYVPLGKDQFSRVYLDEIGPRLLIIIDEVAELLEPSGGKTEEEKEEDAMRGEILSLIKRFTQLGRSAGIHCVLATQRNDTSIIPGVIQNNPLEKDTLVKVE